ncbi:class I SAM-dependent methyltransferase [Gandjariella thermophila]|uniref:class I SAM-dependent methyltransferase n=1 Tax=Gandjariella thermophila TaxID=1931992 RepID=UPI001CEF851B|nr:class I SAM-dependent methyltransferase [Gandjariella thermophila]
MRGILRRCTSCGFTWTAPSDDPTPDTELYDEDYFRDGAYRDYFAEHAQRRYEAARRLRWVQTLLRPRSVLEAGPAAGFFLEAARAAGITVDGVEPAAVCVRFAREHLNLPIRQGCFETSPPPSAPVDAVCAFHVLEHVADPHQFLTAAHRALRPGGALAVEVPNIASAAAARQGGAWHALQPAFHRWHFSPPSLTRLVEGHGFRVEHCDTVSVSYYLRPRYWISPRGGWMLVKEWAGAGNPRKPHPRRFDLLRLLATRRERDRW